MNNEELILARKNAVHILRNAPEELHVQLSYFAQVDGKMHYCAAGYLASQIENYKVHDVRGQLTNSYGISTGTHDEIVRLNDHEKLSFADIADKLEDRWGLND